MNLAATVILTSYNQIDMLRYALHSLTHQDFEQPYELIIVDDGSSENTLSIVQEWISEFNNIKYVWQQDAGFRAGQARNHGIRLARGKIVILLDGDVIPTRSFVRQHVEVHKASPLTLFGGGRKFIHDYDLASISSHRKDWLEQVEARSWTNTEENWFRNRWYRTKNLWKALFSNNLSFPRGTNIGFNEHLYGWGIEDWEFCYQFFTKGYNILYYEDSALVYHADLKDRINNAFRNNDHNQLIDFARNFLVFYDQSQDESLSTCAVALRNYILDESSNRWSFKDHAPLRSYKKAIRFLRDWLFGECLLPTPWPPKGREANYELSVVVSNYKQSASHATLVRSLQSQDEAPSFEMILCDDGSPSSHLQRSKTLFNRSGLQITYVWQPDKGFRVGESRNNAIALSKSKHILFLDGDMIPSKVLLRQHLSALKEKSRTVIAGTRRLIADEDISSVSESSSLFEALTRFSKLHEAEEEFRNYLMSKELCEHPWRLAFGCNVSMPKTRALWFDERLVTYGHEDLELSYRLWKKGFLFSYRPDLIGFHLGAKRGWYKDVAAAPPSRLLEMMEGGLYVACKHPTEEFMVVLVDILKYTYLGKDGEWRFRWKRKPLGRGVRDFLSWRQANPHLTTYPGLAYPAWLAELAQSDAPDSS